MHTYTQSRSQPSTSSTLPLTEKRQLVHKETENREQHESRLNKEAANLFISTMRPRCADEAAERKAPTFWRLTGDSD